MRHRLALALALLWPGPGWAAPVQVTAGEHPGFTRIVLQYESPVDWTMGRTADGYALQLAGPPPRYDLSKVFAQIGGSRLAAIWADPQSGALHVGVGCACYAMPFEFRPGIVVIDLKDGAPPKGSSFEAPLDGAVTALSAPPLLRPRARPGGDAPAAPAAPRPVYDWTAALPVTATKPPAGPVVPQALPELDPALEPLRETLIAELSRGASQGIVDMAKPSGRLPAETETEPRAGPVEIRLGDVDNLAVRQQGAAAEPLTGEGAECIADDRLAIGTWIADGPVADQIGPARDGLNGEFDRPEPEAVARAIRFDLALGFGAEARALMRVFPDAGPDRRIWQSMARLLDAEPDPDPAFAGMDGCDTTAALWAVLADPRARPHGDMPVAAVLRGFSALPAHLRRQLGPLLVDRFLAAGDTSSATALREAVLRAPGPPGPEVALMEAKLAAALGETGDALEGMASLAGASGPAAPEALAALVEQRAQLNQPVSYAQVQELEEYLKERRGGPDEPPFRRALVLAQAASGDFDGAFMGLATAPEAAVLLWRQLARGGSDSALLTHGTLAEGAGPPPEARAEAELIADRMLGLGLPDQALRWLGLVDEPPPLLRARIALAQGDAQSALTILKGREEPEALPLRAEALREAGAERAAAEIYAGLGQPDAQWRASLRGRDWAGIAVGGPAEMRAAAALLLAPPAASAPGTPPEGPLARDAALVTQSLATRQAIDTLLDAIKPPDVTTQ